MKLSVIVPVFNTAGYLPECVGSLLGFDGRETEIILVDDGSTDGVSGALCDRYAAEHPSLVRTVHQENRGLGEARNTGIRQARGEYLLFVDSDDYLLPGAPEKISGCAAEAAADMYVFRFEYRGEDGSAAPAESLPSGLSGRTAADLETVPELLWDPPMAWNRICRKSLFTEHGIFFPAGIWFEDLATTPALLLEAETVVQLPDVLYGYRVREGSITRNRDARRNLDILEALDRVLRYYEKRDASGRYASHLCVLCAEHCAEAARRALMSGADGTVPSQIAEYLRTRFPDIRREPRMSRLGRRKRLLLGLLLDGRFGTARRILLAADGLKKRIRRLRTRNTAR